MPFRSPSSGEALRCTIRPYEQRLTLSTGRVEDVVEDECGVDGGSDLVAVVVGEHAGVFVSELVGDAFEWDAGVGHE